MEILTGHREAESVRRMEKVAAIAAVAKCRRAECDGVRHPGRDPLTAEHRGSISRRFTR